MTRPALSGAAMHARANTPAPVSALPEPDRAVDCRLGLWRRGALLLLAYGVVALQAVAADASGAGSTAASVDVRKLPVGTPFVTSTTPAPGWLYVCPVQAHGRAGAHLQGPWFNGDGSTWNATRKIAVQGSVQWDSTFSVTPSGAALEIHGNGLPSTPVGSFPVQPGDPAFAFDRNPNSARSVPIAWALPSAPQEAQRPSCLPLGAVGVLTNGARLFHAADEMGRDAVAWEVQDQCQGHPERRGAYHHHSVSSCVGGQEQSGQHSALVGYIADGFGLYGNQGEGGRALTNADLDECHGHRHSIGVNGVQKEQYHYHQTQEFPYTVGCFKGTPARLH
ncbi:MAG: YHYH protein [Rhodoferax sp.]